MEGWAANLIGVLVFGGYFGGIAFAFIVPGRIKRRHVARQARLMQRTRALYVAAVEAMSNGAEADARAMLSRIRDIEARWRIGSWLIYRTALACPAIAIGFVGNVAIRLVSMTAIGLIDGASPATMATNAADLAFIGILGFTSVFWGLHSWLDEWSPDWIIDDCGDRLEKYLNSTRGVSRPHVAKERSPRSASGLSDLELFGLPPLFTQRDLGRARRALAAELHPDRWHGASPAVRDAAEEAMKHVNVAYDRLKTKTGP